MLRGAAADDEHAWRRLVNDYSPMVYTWSRRAGLQPTDAADLVQEVMRSVARSIRDFHRDQKGDTFRGWLRRITQRRIVDFRRRRSREIAPPVGGSTIQGRIRDQQDVVDELTSGQVGNVISQSNREALQSVQAEFSSRNWQIFWRVVVDEQDTVDVAEEFGVSPNVVRLAKSRILKRLRESLSVPKQAQ